MIKLARKLRLVVLLRWLASSWLFDEAGSVLKAAEDELGPDHPILKTARCYLAYAYRAAGRLAEAIPL